MALDWSSEPYCRLFKRETDDDLLLSWQARAVWHELLKKFDRSGLIETKRGLKGLAALIRIPFEVVESAIPELLEDGRLRAVTQRNAFIAPNYMTANDTPRSNKARQDEFRKRRRSDVLSTTDHSDEETSALRDVTESNAVSHGVTQSRADTDTELEKPVTRRNAVSRDYDSENPTHRGELAKDTWLRLGNARSGIAKELGQAEPLPLAPITPGSMPRAFDELRDRIREEGPNAPAVINHIFAVLVDDARKTRKLEWLAEKAFTVGCWRTARSKTPPTTRIAAKSAVKREEVFQDGRFIEIEVPA